VSIHVRVGAQIAIPREQLGDDDHARLLARFTHENPAYWDARRNRRPCRHIPREITTYEERNGALLLPRGALVELREALLVEQVLEVQDEAVLPGCVPRSLDATLRDYQRGAVDACLAAGGGVIVAPTGSGKTVTAMGLVAALDTPTLFLVHTRVLLEQTIERARAFLGVEPGVIGGGRDEPSSFTVATVQSLRGRDLSDLRERVGLVILDEAHHCPAWTFRQVVERFPARWRVGLTATPVRRDRLHPVLFDVIGPVCHTISDGALEERRAILRPQLHAVETEFRFFYRRNYSRMITSLTRNADRNQIVIDTILARHRTRSLVASERIAHAELLHARLVAEADAPVALAHGRMPRAKVAQAVAALASGEVEILVTTTSLVGEGFDLPDLDTLFLTVPHGNPGKTTQLMGRVVRPAPGKEAAYVVDFVDKNVPVLKNQWRSRKKVYDGRNPHPV
jgi:superfamily II DNA or RNA helicase